MNRRYILILILIGVFCFLRLYKIDVSLYFFGDYARDYLVLGDWARSGKPPLLGPQTSTLAYNQSAIYFYLLMPLYWLTGHSPFSSVYTVVLVHISAFVFGIYYLRKTRYQTAFIFAFTLLAIHPEFIIQNRGVWNPSFVGISLLLGLFSFLKYTHDRHPNTLFITILCFSLATAFSYSAVPALLALLIVLAVYYRLWFQSIIYTALSLVLVNLPTVAFEARHQFFLSKLLFTGQRMVQEGANLITKLTNLYTYLFHIPRHIPYLLLSLFFLGLLGYLFFQESRKYKELKLLMWLFILTLGITLISPFNLASHYIFPLLILFFTMISLIPIKLGTGIILPVAVFWLIPILRGDYFVPSLRTAATTFACAREVCSNEAGKPMFVSSQSSHYPSHSAQEFQYAFKEAGCMVQNLNTEPDTAQRMAVVVDDSEYTHGKTAYNELTQFTAATSTVETVYRCNDKLLVYMLLK